MRTEYFLSRSSLYPQDRVWHLVEVRDIYWINEWMGEYEQGIRKEKSKGGAKEVRRKRKEHFLYEPNWRWGRSLPSQQGAPDTSLSKRFSELSDHLHSCFSDAVTRKLEYCFPKAIPTLTTLASDKHHTQILCELKDHLLIFSFASGTYSFSASVGRSHCAVASTPASGKFLSAWHAAAVVTNTTWRRLKYCELN